MFHYFVSGFRKDISEKKERVEVSFFSADLLTRRAMKLYLEGIVPILRRGFAASLHLAEHFICANELS